MEIEQLDRAAEQAVNQCLAVKPGETVLVVTDPPTQTVGEALYRAAKAAGAEALLLRMEPRRMHADEPPVPIAAAMKSADVVFGATFKSFSHTAARRQACEAGARIATLPGVTEEIFVRGLSADYEEIAARSTAIAQRLENTREVHITSDLGTDLRFGIIPGGCEADTGLYHQRGDFGNLPSGEGSAGPAEGSSSGRLVIDGSMAGVGLLKTPITLTIRNGLVEAIEGGEEARRLEGILAPYGSAARNIAELGIGTNPSAILTGNVLEDEKILGTIHIALGNNMSYGGTVDVPLHLDGVVMKPTVELDGETIVDAGELML